MLKSVIKKCTVVLKNWFLTFQKVHSITITSPVSGVYRNDGCSLWKLFGTHKYTVWAKFI